MKMDKHRFTFFDCYLSILIVINLFTSCSSQDQSIIRLGKGLTRDELENYNIYEPGLQVVSVITGERFRYSCRYQIDRIKFCLDIGPRCVIKIDWSYPEHVVEKILQGEMGIDGRVRIQKMPDKLVEDLSDTIIYESQLYIQSVGYAHRGIWSCNLKAYDKETGKLESLSKRINIIVKENGERGIDCEHNDHCSSFNCTDNKCICDVDYPLLGESDLCLPAPRIGDNCAIDSDCKISVMGAICQCPEGISEDECSDKSTCQCRVDEVAVNLGFQQIQCMKKAKMYDKCKRNPQCEAVHPNTYCTFAGECRCKNNKCTDLSSLSCKNHVDCGPKLYCSKNRCQVLKTLRSSCNYNDQCQDNSYCSERRICTCIDGYKESFKAAVCIPVNYCENKLDCKNGYCENNECYSGRLLGETCINRKQCQAIDENSICDKNIRGGTCTCAPYYKKSFKGMCIPQDRCKVDNDCLTDETPKGKCLLSECIYPKSLGEECDTSEQCLLQVNYSVCQRYCKCLNPTSDQDLKNNICNSERRCESNEECLDYQYCKKGFCSCEENYKYYYNGHCYKERPQIIPEDSNSIITFISEWRIVIIVSAVVVLLAVSMICLICCNPFAINRKSRPEISAPTNSVQYCPSAPTISTISRGY